MKEYKCKYCGKVFNSANAIGGHTTYCKENPNREKNCKICSNAQKTYVSNTHRPKSPIYEYKCTCEKCGTEYIVNITQSQFDKGKYPKYCSSSCSHSRPQTNETREKIRNSVIKSNETYLLTYERICLHCGKTYKYEENNSTKGFCSIECSKKRKAEKRIISRNNKPKPVKILKVKKEKIKICKICGSVNCTNDFCKKGRKHQQIKNLIKYFTFDEKCFGTLDVFNEYERVKQMLYADYIINELTTREIGKKYNYKSFNNFVLVLDQLGIPRRTLKDAVKLNFKKGISKPSTSRQYKTGTHITWEGKSIFYRSSYELNYAKILDEQCISYEVETLHIQYYDTQRDEVRTAIPDFYLPNENMIVEIKSTYTLDYQNMRDKFRAYKDLGYEYKCILEGKEEYIDLDKEYSIENKRTGNSTTVSYYHMKNKCWVYNTDLKESKAILKDELDIYIEKGWQKGRKMF